MLAGALILDAVFGEPDRIWRRLPHPVVAIGNVISWLDRSLNVGAWRRTKGVLALLALLAIILPLPIIVSKLPYGWVVEILGGAVLLAHRSLVEHVTAVADALDQSLEDGRRSVARIVGRDPETLDSSGVCRAAIESAAENFSDGVVAPAFWFAIAGLPGIVAYKVINTADSMIGHLNDQYRAFGWAAARVDDAVNWIPARITGFLFLAVSGSVGAVAEMCRDAQGHRSPNAGWPEAAIARILDISLAGPRIYGGDLTDDSYINAEGRRDLQPADIRASVRVLWRAWAAVLAFATVLAGILVLI